MKKLACGILLFWGAAVFCAAAGIAEEAESGREKADTSYALGIALASDFVDSGLEINYDAFTRGFREVMEKEESGYTLDEAIEKVQIAFEAARAELAERNRALSAAFLEENAKKPGLVVTPSGLHYELVEEGSGETPGPADTVLVAYRGTTIDGTVFDTTYEQGGPIEIPLERVIPGWSEGLRMMKEGGKAKLYIPPQLAYGENGAGGAIAPNAVLIFEVELLSIVRPPEAEGENAPEAPSSGTGE